MGPGGWEWGSVGGLLLSQKSESDPRQNSSTQVTISPALLQDYELFVEAVEQNTLQEFLKLA